ADFQYAGLTDDSAWHDLDLSSIAPVGTISIHLRVGLTGDSVNDIIKFRKNGNSNEHTMHIQEIVAAFVNQYAEHTVACDSGRIIEYHMNGVTGCTIWVLGWWL
ncbi:hypothetical protein KAR91_34110, partial [Candidatus Pacearchaeota archaeon]|nr:hypothetical protein [Candidatus Pacearchaeota archaeon]